MEYYEDTPIDLKINTLESNLSGWTIAVFVLMSTGLIFYHMTKMKTIEMDSTHAAIFAILLLLSSCSYILFALYNFYHRTYLLKMKFKNRNKSIDKIINSSRIFYTIITSIVSMTTIAICIQIIYNI